MFCGFQIFKQQNGYCTLSRVHGNETEISGMVCVFKTDAVIHSEHFLVYVFMMWFHHILEDVFGESEGGCFTSRGRLQWIYH